jgi:hypothetical protein
MLLFVVVVVYVLSTRSEESCRLLGHLIAAAHRLIKPYVPPILQVCSIFGQISLSS